MVTNIGMLLLFHVPSNGVVKFTSSSSLQTPEPTVVHRTTVLYCVISCKFLKTVSNKVSLEHRWNKRLEYILMTCIFYFIFQRKMFYLPVWLWYEGGHWFLQHTVYDNHSLSPYKMLSSRLERTACQKHSASAHHLSEASLNAIELKTVIINFSMLQLHLAISWEFVYLFGLFWFFIGTGI